MAQVSPRFCPRCSALAIPDQRFCANCGLTLPPVNPAPRVISVAPNPKPSPQFPQVSQSSRQPDQLPSSWRITGSPAPITAPSYPLRRKFFGRAGLALVVLLLLVLLGGGGYLGALALGFHLPGFLGGSVTQPPVTTTQINSTVTYAGADITILTAQQSQSFINDPNTTTTGMVRLNIQEQNKTTVKVSWLYNDIARLLLPGKTLVAPVYVQAKVGLAPEATQKGVLDFSVPTNDKISQLTLRLGAANEAQLDIPLTGHTDLGKYNPKSVQLNGQLLYLGLNWTLVKAMSQLSVAGQQASKGMTYVIVTLKVDNPLSQQAIPGSPFDYARLKAGTITSSPKYTDLPVSFATGETGQSGTITFLVPQSGKAFTLILLPQGGANQAATDFQLA